MRPGTNTSRALRALGLSASVAALCGCGSGSTPSTSTGAGTTNITVTTGSQGATTPGTVVHHPRPAPPNHPRPAPPSVVASSLGNAAAPFAPVVRWRGQTAAWTARTAGGIALLRLDQRLVRLHLHSGTLDAGPGFPFGPAADARETGRLVGAFNGGFRLNVGVGGFAAGGHVTGALRGGLGSVVTYASGRSDIDSWHTEVPAAGQPIASVRQNLELLIDQGHVARTVNCLACWGATLGHVSDPARSALGI
ncbi:MAG: hypothetical protein QOG59_413, partial [Solirubrobacteraceae bacterium]|nr:hypothetical protein [Solirubrobacteraceae bacterium]